MVLLLQFGENSFKEGHFHTIESKKEFYCQELLISTHAGHARGIIMSKSKNYAGIDYFRIIAAVLIVAIHTSPLSSFSEIGDFILTRVIARISVPFFFMTSGFFLISRYTCNDDRLKAFIKKTAITYAAAILIYIPINLYNGYFSIENLLPNIIKDIIFDGTLYHLWYLPASIIGSVIAWYFVKKLDYPKALVITVILYIIGLFGDSYYGISEKISVLKIFYELIFQVSDYTRNGLFFAPVFFVVGGMIAEKMRVVPQKQWEILGFAVSFAFLFAEAMVLHSFDIQRHDSMYLFLLPCMFFLFCLLLHWKRKRVVWLRTLSLLVYIIHPMMIVVIRLLAKILGLQNILVENSIVHYFVVCLLSIMFAGVATVFWNRYGIKNNKQNLNMDRAWIEINLNNLTHNVNTLHKAMPPECEMMAVVKAESYGHGGFAISTHLAKMGVKAFAVATIDEGIKLRRYGIRGEILILGYTNVSRAKELKKYDLTQTLIDFNYAKELDRQGIMIKVHLKVDTGMHRLGMGISSKNCVQLGSKIFSMKHIKVCGIYTHLCCADSLLPEDVSFTRNQIRQFYSFIDALEEKGIVIPKVHIQSSYGLLNYPELECDYVRIGIALYGVLSTPNNDTMLKLDLRPVLSLKTKVALVRNVRKGDCVGYGRSFVAKRDSVIAILPIGYADGFPRNLSGGRGSVLINGQRVSIIGRICMDQMMIDVTDLEQVSVGDLAILIGSAEGTMLSAPAIAGAYGSISNELLSRMGARLPNVCIESP